MKNEGDERDSGVLSAPLSFLRSGNFFWRDASPINRNGYGYYLSLHSASTDYAYSLGFRYAYLGSQYRNDRGDGFAVRCVSFC